VTIVAPARAVLDSLVDEIPVMSLWGLCPQQDWRPVDRPRRSRPTGESSGPLQGDVGQARGGPSYTSTRSAWDAHAVDDRRLDEIDVALRFLELLMLNPRRVLSSELIYDRVWAMTSR
jgi:hypothetical protein